MNSRYNFWIILLMTSTTLIVCSIDLTKEPGHLKPIGTGRPSLKVEETYGFTAASSFISNFVLNRKPLKMKDAAKLSPAYSLWSDDYFLSFDLPDDVKVSVETIKKESRQQDILEMHFQDFVRAYNTTGVYMVNSVPDFICKDVLLPCSIQCEEMMHGGLVEAMMWYSSGGTSSVLHTDSVDNINCIYRGNKTFLMIDPSVYGDKVDIDRPEGSYSAVDVDSVDYLKYPGLAEVEYYTVHATAGDCLYIPYKWVHQVKSFGSNIAVNIWWDHHKMVQASTDRCSKDCNLDLTLNDLSFHGFSNVLDNKDAIKDHIKDFIGMSKHLEYAWFEKTFLSDDLDALEERGALDEASSHIREVFILLDTNHDEKITRQELDSLPEQIWKSVQESVMKLDKFLDKTLSTPESIHEKDEL